MQLRDACAFLRKICMICQPVSPENTTPPTPLSASPGQWSHGVQNDLLSTWAHLSGPSALHLPPSGAPLLPPTYNCASVSEVTSDACDTNVALSNHNVMT